MNKILLLSCLIFSINQVSLLSETSTIQAESYKNSSETSVENKHSGYRGTGYTDMGVEGTWFTLDGISGNGTPATLSIRYATSINSRPCEIFINGESQAKVEFSSTNNWTNWSSTTVSISLPDSTNNSITFVSGKSGGPNIDEVSIQLQDKEELPTAGHIISLKAVNGKYVSADNEEHILIANKDSVGPFEKFEVIEVSEGSFALKCLGNLKYLVAENKGSSSIKANRTNIGNWEKFSFANNENKIYLTAHVNGLIISAENGGKDPLIASRENARNWESFTWAIETPEDIPLEGLLKPEDTLLRVANYNVMQSRIFKGNTGLEPQSRYDSWVRLVDAIKADVWVLQEMFYDAAGVDKALADDFIEHMKSITGNKSWNYGWDAKGRMVLSKFPIKWSAEVRHRVHATWIDMPPSISSKDLLIINVHLRTSTTEQAQDAIEFIRAVRAGEYSVNIPRDVSVIFCGDFNAGSNSGAYKTVFNEGLLDVEPVHTDLENEMTTFGKVNYENGSLKEVLGSKIDYFFYDSNDLVQHNNFLLNTFALSQEVLEEYGLTKADLSTQPDRTYDYENGKIECDHFPIIVDFTSN